LFGIPAETGTKTKERRAATKEKRGVSLISGMDVENSVIQKFINETYHIENEFISQLDPAKFDTIPEYVVAECDKLVNGAGV
jgi:hypothetical protein